MLLPLFPNSVVSNDIDFITESDDSAYAGITFLGRSAQEMPSNPAVDLVQDDVYVFEMSFNDGSTVQIFADARFASIAEAQAEVAHFAGPLGRLPGFMRAELGHVVLNIADHIAFEEADGGFFVVSTQNMALRRANHDMEETVFHESAHVALDNSYADSPGWLAAQAADGVFVTEYGQQLPAREDLAETALFAYTYFTHPLRLSLEIRMALEEEIPARLAFFEALFAADGAGVITGSPISDTLRGTIADDTIYGLAEDDIIDAGRGDDVVYGGNGADTLQGWRGSDLLLGGAGDDRLDGGSGDDTLFGRDGADTLIGGSGDDVLRGGHGNDVLKGGDGDDALFGVHGDDTLFGRNGSDQLNGGAGDDRLSGGRGDDTLFGGIGADRLDGGFGNDLLTGGAGADLFVFRPGRGQDRVLDFERGVDQVALGYGFSSFAEVAARLSDMGQDAVFTGDDGSTLLFEGISAGMLDGRDFGF